MLINAYNTIEAVIAAYHCTSLLPPDIAQMARFFSTTASSASKRSLAFIGRAASRLINTIQSAVHRPEHQQVLSETVDGESTPPQIQTTPDVDTETVAATDEGGETSSEESGKLITVATYEIDDLPSYTEVLDIVTSEDSDDTEDESTAANPDQNAIPTHAPFRARKLSRIYCTLCYADDGSVGQQPANSCFPEHPHRALHLRRTAHQSSRRHYLPIALIEPFLGTRHGPFRLWQRAAARSAQGRRKTTVRARTQSPRPVRLPLLPAVRTFVPASLSRTRDVGATDALLAIYTRSTDFLQKGEQRRMTKARGAPPRRRQTLDLSMRPLCKKKLLRARIQLHHTTRKGDRAMRATMTRKTVRRQSVLGGNWSAGKFTFSRGNSRQFLDYIPVFCAVCIHINRRGVLAARWLLKMSHAAAKRQYFDSDLLARETS